MTSSSSSNVVSTTTRTPVRAASSTIDLVAAMPSMTGIRMSIRTTSGRYWRTTPRPPRPSAASPTTAMSPSRSARVRNPVRTSSWSSTSTILITRPASPGSGPRR
jgi:hypothetical protein